MDFLSRFITPFVKYWATTSDELGSEGGNAINQRLAQKRKNMDFNNFTVKSQEAIQKAAAIAQADGQQALEPLHILKGIMETAPDVSGYISNKCGLAPNLGEAIDRALKSLPKVRRS